MDMITSKKGTLQYMTDALRKYRDDGLLDDRWLQVMNWYEEKDLDDLRRVRSGMDFNNRVKALGDSFADSYTVVIEKRWKSVLPDWNSTANVHFLIL